ncbi:MAG: sigma-54-dependent Fis family transcriptional regulator [Blastocatellia bacterium]|nr:sigma-54-dependent Fis family transcriptional regulator [Blastocatellia bacterium]
MMSILGDRNVSKVEAQKFSALPEAGTLMALLTEINHLMDGTAETTEIYAQVGRAVREGLGAFCVAIVHLGSGVGSGVGSATNLTVCALSTAPSFRPSELSDLLKEGRQTGEMMRALGRAGLYARKLQTERVLHLTAARLPAQRGGQKGFLLALSDFEFAPVEQETLRLVARLLGSIRPARIKTPDKVEEMVEDNHQIKERLSEHYNFSLLVGASWPLRQVFEQIAQIACTKATVLITGETGSGKELVARTIHINSPRAGGPFVAVNCAALAEGVVESELFGHERGAFTGATSQRAGYFERANTGTLLLDEIGEISLASQAKLLRVLQNGEFERVGGTSTIKTDIRVIAATGRNLEEEIAAGRFRQDLYYRLNLFPIIMPALRDRRDDIPALAEFFLERTARRMGKAIRGFSAAAMDLLTGYQWPGNVRELENVVESAVVVAEKGRIDHYHLPPALQVTHPMRGAEGLFRAVETYEHELILEALGAARGNRTQAAKLLKVSERVLSYKIKKYGIDCASLRRD